MCVRPAAVRDTNPHHRALCSVNQPPNLLWVMDIQQKRLFECYLKNIKPGFSTSFLGCFVLLLWDETKQSRRCRQVHMGVLPLQGLGKDNLVMVNPSGSPFDIRGKASRNLETQSVDLGWDVLGNSSTTSRTLCPYGCSLENLCFVGPPVPCQELG